MEKLYQKIGWENLPSKKTPINDENLGKVDKAIDDLDNRIIENDANYNKLLGDKANSADVKKMTDDLSLNKANGKGITFSINDSGGLRVTYDDGK